MERGEGTEGLYALKVGDTEGVVVVGASVAGLFAAYRLGQAGVRVRVFEAQAALEPDPRTFIGTPPLLRMLDFELGDAVLNRTCAFELISPNRSARVRLREPDLVVGRARFVQDLARRAQGAGAELLFDRRFERLFHGGRFPLLRFATPHGPHHRKSATVIGADGVDSTLRSEVGRHQVPRVGKLQARVGLRSDQPADTVRCWFERGTTRFFTWLIPESERIGALGLIAPTEEQAARALEAFMADHDLRPVEDGYQQGLVPLHASALRVESRLGGGTVLLVGDAAGQVKATTVGGFVTGMRGGAAAARSIIRGTTYAAEAGALHRELRAHTALRFLLDGFRDQDYDRLLALLNRGTRRVLRRYNRDELRRSLWRLVLAQPRWITLGARAFVQSLGSG